MECDRQPAKFIDSPLCIKFKEMNIVKIVSYNAVPLFLNSIAQQDCKGKSMY